MYKQIAVDLAKSVYQVAESIRAGQDQGEAEGRLYTMMASPFACGILCGTARLTRRPDKKQPGAAIAIPGRSQQILCCRYTP
ncbi:hypothetical protein D3C78_490450 [compost metagenome]